MFDKNSLDSGVSPVVGVILMVAVTVILAAVIGSFVTGLSDNLEANPQAGVTFDQVSEDSAPGDDTTADGEVQVQVVNMDDADKLEANGTLIDSDGDGNTTVGETASVTNLNSGDQITVTATLEGKTNVIQTYTAD